MTKAANANIETVSIGPMQGGAWKVAYADFVTAMMAFFLLLWLLNVSTDEELNAISNYFDPTHPKVSMSESGAGGIMGGLSMSPQGSMATDKQTLTPPPRPSQQALTSRTGEKMHEDNAPPESQSSDKNVVVKQAVELAKEKLKAIEEKKFEDLKEQIQKTIEADPELKELAKNLLVDVTPEGLRIQIIDQEGNPMFASGSAQMFEKTRNLISKMTDIIQKMPNDISIRGHTDSVPYGAGANYTNWELSSDRANAARRVMKENGVAAERLHNVVGKADTEHLIPERPEDAQNRRISIILLREEVTKPESYQEKAEEMAEEIMEQQGSGETGADGEIIINESEQTGNTMPSAPPVGTFRRTPGTVEFP